MAEHLVSIQQGRSQDFWFGGLISAEVWDKKNRNEIFSPLVAVSFN